MSDIKQRWPDVLREYVEDYNDGSMVEMWVYPETLRGAADEIERLEALWAKAASDLMCCDSDLVTMQARVAELGQSLRRSMDNEVALCADRDALKARAEYELAAARAEAEAWRKDAERLNSRRIRIGGRNEFGEPVIVLHTDIDLRAAIDAAREGGK